MKLRHFFLLLSIILTPLMSLHSQASESLVTSANEELDEDLPDPYLISEAFGFIIAKNLSDNLGFQFDLESIIKGIQASMRGEGSPMSEEEYESAIIKIQQKYFNEMAANNLAQADDFMLNNLKEQNVSELIPGKLHISIIKEGKGEAIQENDVPIVHYTGRYLDQTVFGSSEEVGEPVSLQLDQAIPGFKQGLIGAKEGEERRIFIHPELGYGASDVILPNAMMIFDVKVIQAKSEDTSD